MEKESAWGLSPNAILEPGSLTRFRMHDFQFSLMRALVEDKLP
jgi:hypothetical protein